MTRDEIIDEVIERGLSDWVMDTEVIGAIREGARTDDPLTVRQHVLEVVTAVVSRGMAELGDTPREGGFHPWKLPLDEALARITRKWDALPEPYPQGGELFWLRNTPRGKDEAERILDRWDTEGIL